MELEKRAVRDSFQECAITPDVPWFSDGFGLWLENALSDKQMTGQILTDFLWDHKPAHCFITAWRYLYEAAKLGQIIDQDGSHDRKWRSLIENIPMLWSGLVTLWNKQLNHFEKNAANNRYKYFMERFILADYSPDRLSSQEASSKAGLPLKLCDKVWKFVQAELRKSGRHTSMPLHVYSMVQALEVRGCIPHRRLGVATRILGERYGVQVKKGYRPDKPRGENWQYGTADQEVATAAAYDILARLYPDN